MWIEARFARPADPPGAGKHSTQSRCPPAQALEPGTLQPMLLLLEMVPWPNEKTQSTYRTTDTHTTTQTVRLFGLVACRRPEQGSFNLSATSPVDAFFQLSRHSNSRFEPHDLWSQTKQHLYHGPRGMQGELVDGESGWPRSAGSVPDPKVAEITKDLYTFT